ncbi:MAG: 4Fe-4S binding protein [Deltaproteobacteria bacterium]|jgi:ferredoxin-type protein NapH|nr:4Fe-4S binding protein [Deltaproteobacteria bacterium]
MLPEARRVEAADTASAGARRVKPAPWNVWYVRLRRPVQFIVALLFVVLPWANAQGWTRIYGSLFAMNIYGLPLADPLSALQVLVIDGHVAVRLWTGAALVLLMACALGRVFCSWLCPYGLLSELVYALRRRLPPLFSESMTARRAYWLRIALCAAGLVAAFACAFPVLQRFSMPGELSLAPLRVLDGWEIGMALLLPPGAALLAEGISGRRLWCRYLCPQSVFLALAAQCFPGGFGVRWDSARCACPHGDHPCLRACSLGLAPRHIHGPPRSECTQCAQCVRACAERGAALRIGL